ncbi:MAG TPA: diguanylate cyclase, partial [Acidimicrobiales bacterium]
IPIYLRVRHTSRLRGAWIAMGAGVVLYNVANLVYLFHDQNLNPVPSPAPSDVPYLLSYVAWVIGIVMMTQGSFGAVRVSTRLDGLVSGLAIAAVAGMLWFDPVLRVSGRPLQVVVGMSYPLFDLVLLVLLAAGLAPMRYRPNLSTLLLMLGVTSFVIGDVIYLNQVAAGTYVGGTLLDATWTIGIWLIGLAAWPREDRRLEPRPAPSAVPTGITLVPIFFGGISVAVLVISLVHHTSKVTSLLALGALCLVVVRMGLTLRDVRVVEQVNFRVARLDELTGLRNRRGFFEDGATRFATLGPGDRIGIILMDLDGFKEINDSLGHASGDDLLRIVGRRFSSRLGARGVVSRIGGDEFACTCAVESAEELTAIGHDLVASLSDPITLDGLTVRVSASAGVAVYPEHGTTEAELLRCADVAMYEAKQGHAEVRLYRPEVDMNSRDRLAMIDDLRAAIDRRALTLHFQPTLDLRTGRVHGLEALVRWRHPTFGLLYPEDFVPLAERVGLIRSMTRLVIELAIEELARLDASGNHLQMSVNISRYDLIDEALPSHIVSLL